MNNYPNFMGQRYPAMQPMQNYNFQPMAQVPQIQAQQMPSMPPVVEPVINYDFYGVQVKSFEEAQKYPYCCEKPLFLLDAQNEKVYIKKIDQNGIPSVMSYEIKEIKENTVQAVQKNEQLEEKKEPEIDFLGELSKMKEELTKQFTQEIKNQMNELKATNENAIKSNKKW
jgi:hypothetical protein